MKVLLITDQHFGVRNDHPVFIEKYREFYTNTVIPYIKKHKIKTVFCLGDTFDKRKSINFASLDAAKEMWFDPLQELGVAMIMLIGNHDIYYKNTLRVNAPNHLLGEYDNITVIESPTEFKFGEKKILFLPWICPDNKDDVDDIIDKSTADILLGHLELSGFEAVPGHIMEHGENPERYGKFPLVCTGHYHMKSRQNNIQYLGNPYHLYWNDYGQDRGFHVLNTDTLNLTFVKNPYDIFCKLYYDDSRNDYDDIPDLTELKGAFVKLIVQNRSNQKWFDRMIKALQQADVADLKIIEDLTLDAPEIKEDVKMEDTMSILETYVMDLEESVDKKNVVNILKSLYVESLNL